MSLYQSYRPKVFSDVVGQSFIKKILANSCKKQLFHHGYIFFGFHGIGKTTLARIFAEAVNCTSITAEGNPCHTCQNCQAYDEGRMIDVIEIDAASYTGVDNIREVIDHAKFTPTQGKYKVYIIDEVHMLSRGAFNALLKTLEEPPAHTIFLLATTEIQKVPDTILSRVIRFDLTKIGEQDMYDLLIKICKQEGIEYQEEALKMIIHRSRGSIRDALTMMEKCILDKNIETSAVESALHLVNSAFLQMTFEACETGNIQKIQTLLSTLEQEGTDIRQFAAQMTEWIADHIQNSFEEKKFPLYKEIFELFTRVFVQSRQVAAPMDILSMELYSRVRNAVSPEQKHDIKKSGELKKSDEQTSEKVIKADIPNEKTSTFSAEDYIKKLQELGIKNTLIPLLKTAKIEQDGDTIVLSTTSFCQSRCAETSIRQVLEEAARAFHTEKIKIIVEAETSRGEDPPESAEDIARAVFST